MKFSDNPDKSTNPGVKQLWRLYGDDGLALADLMTLEDEGPDPARSFSSITPRPIGAACACVPPRPGPSFQGHGRRQDLRRPLPALADIRAGLRARFERFDSTFLRLLNPHVYKVSISSALRDLKLRFIGKYMKDGK